MSFETNGFQIGQKFAEGVFGETFIARPPAPHASLCAIKKLSAMAVDRSHLTATLSQLQALEGHPGIVKIVAWSTASSPLWVASEFQGTDAGIAPSVATLFGHFRSEEDAFPLLSELASTLGAFHSEGILHGNLHPGNIFLAPEGSPVQCRIGDFGQAFIGTAHHVALTADSLRTLAPEQLLRPEEFRSQNAFRWDVYAFGVLAFRILTGLWPRGQKYIGAHTAECDAHHGAPLPLDPHRFLASLEDELEITWPGVPASDPCLRIRELIADCLSLAPEKRPRTGSEIEFRLAQISHDIKTAQAERRFAAERKSLKRNLLLARSAAAVLISLLTAATIYGISTLHRARLAESTVHDQSGHLALLGSTVADSNAAYAASLDHLWKSRDAADLFFTRLWNLDPLSTEPRILSPAERNWIERARTYYSGTLPSIGASWAAEPESARAHHNLAHAALALGEIPVAENHFREAIALLDPLSATATAGSDLHAELFSRLGDCHRQLWIQQPLAWAESSLAHLDRSASAFLTALESRPDDPQLMANAAASFFYLGLHQGECRLRQPALVSFSRCLELLALIEKRRTPEPKDRFLAARAYTASGTLLRELGRGPAALDAQVLALGILLELTAESPQHTDFEVELARCYCELGDLFQSVEHEESAPDSDPAQMFNEANRILLSVLTQHPSHPRATVALARTYMGQSKLSRGIKKSTEAVRLAQLAVSLLTELGDLHPENRQIPFQLAHHKVEYMQLLAAVARSQDAIKFGMEASATLESLLDEQRDLAAEPLVKSYQHALADLHEQLGTLTENASNTQSAAEHYARAVGYWELLASHYGAEEEFGIRLKASRSMLQRVRQE